jgi:SAM-dependent methyltransferase
MNKLQTEVNTGWRTVLTLGFVYRIVQFVFSEKRSKQLILERYILPAGENCSVLDMGCGPGNLLAFLPATVSYNGFDLSQEYISSAKKAFTGREHSQFICAATGDSKLDELVQDHSIDVAIVHGVFHHISDQQAGEMFALARKKVRAGGKIVILEPVWFEQQSRFRRWVMSKDRGRNIKSLENWQNLFQANTAGWADTEVEVQPNLIRFYDLVVCTVTVK